MGSYHLLTRHCTSCRHVWHQRFTWQKENLPSNSSYILNPHSLQKWDFVTEREAAKSPTPLWIRASHSPKDKDKDRDKAKGRERKGTHRDFSENSFLPSFFLFSHSKWTIRWVGHYNSSVGHLPCMAKILYVTGHLTSLPCILFFPSGIIRSFP